MKILIVDDEQAILKIYTLPPEAAGYEVLNSSKSQEVLELVKKEKPVLIFLDIIMPQINGLDVLKTLKDDEATKNIPVYLLTNLPEECSADKTKELGAAGYFVKAQTEPNEVVEIAKKVTG